jgi:hypothetical protein
LLSSLSSFLVVLLFVASSWHLSCGRHDDGVFVGETGRDGTIIPAVVEEVVVGADVVVAVVSDGRTAVEGDDEEDVTTKDEDDAVITVCSLRFDDRVVVVVVVDRGCWLLILCHY